MTGTTFATIEGINLHTQQEGAIPLDAVSGLADSLPDVRFRRIDGAGHTPSVENPVAMANAITQFLKEHGYV